MDCKWLFRIDNAPIKHVDMAGELQAMVELNEIKHVRSVVVYRTRLTFFGLLQVS